MKKTLLIIGVFILSQVLAGIVAVIVAIIRLHSQGKAFSADFEQCSSEILIALMVSEIIIIIATILICRKGFKAPFRWSISFGKGLAVVVLSIVGFSALVVLTEALAEWLSLPDYMEETFKVASLSSLSLWAMAVVGPISEEIAFRYGIAGSLMESTKMSKWLVVLISALLFSLLHMNPAQMLTAFILGLFLGWLYVITLSIWPCIICHVANNAVSVILMRENSDNMEDATLSSMIPDSTWFAVTLCGCAVVLLLSILALRHCTRK